MPALLLAWWSRSLDLPPERCAAPALGAAEHPERQRHRCWSARSRYGLPWRRVRWTGVATAASVAREQLLDLAATAGLARRGKLGLGLSLEAAGLKTQAEAELASARKTGSSGEVEKLLASNGGSGSDAGSISPFATEVRTESGRTSTVASASQDAPLPPAPAPRNAQAANPSSWTTTQGEAPASPPPSSGNRISRWWGSVRGSSSEPEPEPTPAPAPQTAPKATAAAVPSAWTTQTQPEAGAAPGTRVATASPASPVPSGGGGNYLLQLSPTRSEAEASALWKTVIKQNQQLASLQPRVEKTDMGNLGTFYRLQIGPFPDKAESLKLCNALKRSGVDCFLVNP